MTKLSHMPSSFNCKTKEYEKEVQYYRCQVISSRCQYQWYKRSNTYMRSDYLYSRCMPLLKRRRCVYQFTQDQVTLYVYIAQIYIHLPGAKCVIHLKRCGDSFVRSKTWQVFPIHYVCMHYPCKEALKEWFAISGISGVSPSYS